MKLPELPAISPELREQAERIIAERAKQYGDAEPCFTRIAARWHECLKTYAPEYATVPLPSYMVGLMMAAFKTARLEMCDGMSEDKRRDDIIDRYNYIKLARDMVAGEGASTVLRQVYSELVDELGEFEQLVKLMTYVENKSGSQRTPDLEIEADRAKDALHRMRSRVVNTTAALRALRS